MSADKLDTILSIVLLSVGATSRAIPDFIANVDIYITFGFHLLSALSVFMVVVLNRKKFILEIKSWFNRNK